jgi:adenylate kinase family enzyme
MRRVNVVGTCGSGKTTLARALADRLGAPHVELDAFRHGPGWVETPDPLFRARVADAVAAEAWVVDGNYGLARDIIWGRADTVVWLDYPFRITFGRLLRRTARRIMTGEELWNGNRESLRMALSRDSILLWALRTYVRRKRAFPELFARPEYAHLTTVRLPHPRAAEMWLESLSAGLGVSV